MSKSKQRGWSHLEVTVLRDDQMEIIHDKQAKYIRVWCIGQGFHLDLRLGYKKAWELADKLLECWNA